MKIILKTLKGNQLPIEVEEATTIDALKQQIETTHGEAYPADQQNLLFAGKVMAEGEKSVGEYNIKDGAFVVLMIKKSRAARKVVEKPVEEKPEVAKKEDPEKPEVAEVPVVSQAQPQPQAEQPAAQQQPAPVEVNQETLDTLMAISGKSRDLCAQALKAAFNDADRAFDYLSEGIPQQFAAPQQQHHHGQQQPEAGGIPNMNAIREMIMQNPQGFMQGLQERHPELFAQLQANPQILFQLLASGGDPTMNPGAGSPDMSGASSNSGAGFAGAGEAPPRQNQLNVTAEEKAAIENLASLGFSMQMAAQAYMACDKNEELAANFLFNQGEQDFGGFQPAPLNDPVPVVVEAQPEPKPEEVKPEEDKPVEDKPKDAVESEAKPEEVAEEQPKQAEAKEDNPEQEQ